MSKYHKSLKLMIGLALVLALAISSFNQPNLAVASTDFTANPLHDAVNLGMVDASYTCMVSPSIQYITVGSLPPVLVQATEKLFDH